MNRGLEKIRRELREREKKWKIKREELERGIEELEKITEIGQERVERIKQMERRI